MEQSSYQAPKNFSKEATRRISARGRMAMFSLLIICLAVVAHVGANVIGLDFGSDSMKVALVAPGAPLEIVTNFQSKRKTPTAVTFYRGERMFGSDSMALIARKPDLSFARIYRLLGRSASHPVVEKMKKDYFPYEVYGNETMGGTTCLKQEETFYTPEELMAMMMQHAKDMTANYGGKQIKDCVITVPSYFTQHERRALYSAADIANLRVLSLIEENTAAALHYGIDRVFEEPKTILYYNMGASAVQVTIATYHSYTVKEAGKNKTIGQFEVVGKGWDEDIGGFNFDVRLAEMLADRFNELWSKKKSYKEGDKLQSFIQPMTRLRTQATKVKEVLSANPEFPVRVEQLHNDIDLNTKVTRAEFEEKCSDLFARVTAPIDAALAMAGLDLAKVDAVELLGGSVRMPKVKSLLDEYFGKAESKEDKIEVGQHLNGDEAMALGAAFRAANLSTSFRVRKVGMWDSATFGINVELENLPDSEKKGGAFGGLFGGKKKADDEEGDVWRKKTGLWAPRALLPAKSKTVAITHDHDIVCRVEYDDQDGKVPLPEGSGKLLAVYNVTGIADFVEEHRDKELGTPKVHLSFALDASGVVGLVKAEATLDLPVEEEAAETGGEGKVEEDKKEEDKKEEGEDKKEKDEDKKEEAGADGEEKKEEGDEDKKEEKEEEQEEAKGTADADEEKKEKKEEDKEKKEKKSTLHKGKDKDKKEERKKKKDTQIRKVLLITEDSLAPSPPVHSEAMIAASQAKLKGLDDADEARKQREAALNDLEGYIYSVKGKIQEQEEELGAVSTAAQREAVLSTGTELEDWLYEAEAKTADVATFKAKHRELRRLAEPIFDRFAESSARPEAVKTARKTIATVREKLADWPTSRPWVNETEIAKVSDLLGKAEAWLDDKEQEQSAVDASEEPVFRSEDVPKQLTVVAREFERLLKKPKPAPPKVDKGNSTTNANATASSNTTEASGEGEGDAEPVKVEVKVDGAEEEKGEADAEAEEAAADASEPAADDAAGKGEL